MSNDSFVPVSIRHLSKLYGTVKALDDVSLEIGAGEFMSLLGPSARARPPCSACSAGSTARLRAASSSASAT